ncbi:PTS glucose transporter subunit IIA [uncultured Lactobacillus sp.]|uniref:PTS sugar transporter subunit IIA n=1 Tax=uncultured Lactobacillus sp. TaxID=153152 RepID=UPI002664E4EF|nr:PTS glucose transporter subunit IIA [uncultured Lactobacillus sp.]
MFNFFKKGHKSSDSAASVIKVPVDGDLIPITEVSDDVFSQKMLGDGFAVKPSSKEIFAPVDGKISTLFPTKHAIGITTKEGLEILLHLGIDTVELKGEPFEVHVAQDDEVKAGQKLIDMDIDAVTKSGRDNTVIVVYTNMDKLKQVKDVNPRKVAHGDDAQEIVYNDED